MCFFSTAQCSDLLPSFLWHVVDCVLFLCVQVIRKGEVSCCWICTTCKDNEYVQDEFTCKACELGWWPDDDLAGRTNKNRNCVCFYYIVHPHSLSITPETVHTYYFAHFMCLPLAQPQYF